MHRRDPVFQLGILILALLIFLRYLSLGRSREFISLSRRILSEFESQYSEMRSHQCMKISSEMPSQMSDFGWKAEIDLAKICKLVNQRHYSQARKLLSEWGFQDPIVSKRGELILIKHAHGKLVMDSSGRILG